MTTIRLQDGVSMTIDAARRLRDALDREIRAAEQPPCCACRGSGRSTVCALACPRCGGSGKEPF